MTNQKTPSSKIRLYIGAEQEKLSQRETGFAASSQVELSPDQHHYLRNVMRCAEGDKLLVFNGRDGEWQAEIAEMSKKQTCITLLHPTRAQTDLPDIWLLFAPIKKGRLDYMAQKATEMGARVIWPVRTAFTQGGTLKESRLRANAIEAAEQCGLLAVPAIKECVDLQNIISNWEQIAPSRQLIFCDEKAAPENGLAALDKLKGQPVAVLIGPEGGFNDAERAALMAMPAAHIISLGPRILRADTAAVAALAACQIHLGDW